MLFSQNAIEKRMNRALGKGRIRLGPRGEAPNFIRVSIAQKQHSSPADEEHTLSLIKNSLVAMSRTGDIASEFVALVEFCVRPHGLVLRHLDDIDIEAERRTANNIEEVIEEESSRIATRLLRLIRFPNSFVTFDTSFAGTVRTGTRLLIGRSPECDLVIGDQVVSSHHAVVSWSPDDECWHVFDLGSVNGTVVDGAQLCKSQARLLVGSTIAIAQRYTLTVASIEGADEPVSSAQQQASQESRVDANVELENEQTKVQCSEVKQVKDCGECPSESETDTSEFDPEAPTWVLDRDGGERPAKRTPILNVPNPKRPVR